MRNRMPGLPFAAEPQFGNCATRPSHDTVTRTERLHRHPLSCWPIGPVAVDTCLARHSALPSMSTTMQLAGSLGFADCL